MKFGHLYAANFLGRVASIFPELLLNYAGRKYLTTKRGSRKFQKWGQKSSVPNFGMNSSAELGIPSE